MTLSFIEQVAKEAQEAVSRQNGDGSFPPGCNGPYGHIETPVRNTAHWLFTFSVLYEKMGGKAFKTAAEKALTYLLGEESRPMKAAFWCRKNPERDFCNGLIGQAWVMEGLLKAASVFDHREAFLLAEKVYHLHPWIPDQKVWKRVNVEGSYGSCDPTFNHQLWFAAISSQISDNELAATRAKEFLAHHISRLGLYRDGILYHLTPLFSLRFPRIFHQDNIGVFHQKAMFHLKKRELYEKSAGYHAFNLYAFAVLKERFPNLKVWKHSAMEKMLKPSFSKKFRQQHRSNPYSYRFNPTGLEMAYAMEVFYPELKEEIAKWLHTQVEETGEKGVSIMTKGSVDAETSRARIYEGLRLKRDYAILVE